MKIFFTSVLAAVCLAVIVFGNISWNKKIENTSANPNTEITSSSGQAADLTKYSSNWPEQSAEVFKTRLADGEPFKIVLAGSPEIENDEFSLAEALQNAISETYGNSLEISTITFDATSAEFLEEGYEQELADLNADMIIFESLSLKDNGEVVIEDSHENISTVIQAVTAGNPAISFILQPPPPLFEATFYPRQVEELKNYADANGIPYLDYWSAFPEEGSDTRASFFTEDQESLNEDGYALWINYLEDYLINK